MANATETQAGGLDPDLSQSGYGPLSFSIVSHSGLYSFGTKILFSSTFSSPVPLPQSSFLPLSGTVVLLFWVSFLPATHLSPAPADPGAHSSKPHQTPLPWRGASKCAMTTSRVNGYTCALSNANRGPLNFRVFGTP